MKPTEPNQEHYNASNQSEKLNRRKAIKQLTVGTAGLSLMTVGKGPFISCAPNRTKHPNIIIIYPDQQNQESLGAYGNTTCKTPHIDRLASEGVRFDNLTTPSARCTPSRASLLTGMYPHRHRVTDNNLPLPPQTVCFSDVLNEQGYTCIYVGKWHLLGGLAGGLTKPRYVPPKHRHGFSKWIGSNVGHEKTYTRFVQDDDSRIVTDQYSTDGIVEDAIKLMEESRNKPFLCMISILDPHTPWAVRAPYSTMYDPASLLLAPNYISDVHRVPDGPARRRYTDIETTIARWQNSHGAATREEAFKQIKAQYYGMVSCIDENVGHILDWLKQRGLDEDTIVVFTTDHGEFMSGHGLLTKGIPYEEAQRVPFILRYPKMIQRGTINAELTSIIDVLPTLMELTQSPFPPYIQGQSVAPLLRGEQQSLRDAIYGEIDWETDAQRTIRTSRYKYIFNNNAPDELYDLKDDPLEMQNIYNEQPYAEIQDELYSRLKHWVDEGHSPAVSYSEIRMT